LTEGLILVNLVVLGLLGIAGLPSGQAGG